MRDGFVMPNSSRVSHASKRAVNLSIDAALLAEARGFGLNLLLLPTQNRGYLPRS